MARSTADAAHLTKEEEAVLSRVDQYLADGIALKRWWNSAGPEHNFDQRFELTRSPNRPSESYGFFGTAHVDNKTLPIMGNVQDLFFDQPKTTPGEEQKAVEWTRKQLREFVLHYFMRVSSFREPETVISESHPELPGWLANLSWCPTPNILREGFGFSQLYYKTFNGDIGKFTDRSAIVDVREIGDKYEWIVLKVRILNFAFAVSPFGPSAPKLQYDLDEHSYLVMTRDFIVDQERPSPGIAGKYGVGYAFIKSPRPSLLAYGPGEFDAAIELIEFRISETGEVTTHMVFVVNRPSRIANVPLDPVDWSFRIANRLSMGATSRFVDPLRRTLEKLPARLSNFDPVYSFVSLLNTLTANQAAKTLCISKETLDKRFLVQHFRQHYETIAGSLLTWRQVRNWLDAAALPEWVVTGRSS